MKVCIIYGSESGNSERAVKAIAKTWQGSNFEIGEIMEGATAAVRGFAALAEQYDFLVVATSSNGEGDPPFNFHPFLKALYAADDAGDKPLTGCGFAVLGFGCSHFDTFQNCPRLTDKLLADLGAIRAVSREECDDSDEAHTAKAKAKWGDTVLKVLQSGKIPSAHVGDWTDACTQNGATILDKHDDMLVAAAQGAPSVPLLVFGALAVAAAGVAVSKFAALTGAKSPSDRRS